MKRAFALLVLVTPLACGGRSTSAAHRDQPADSQTAGAGEPTVQGGMADGGPAISEAGASRGGAPADIDTPLGEGGQREAAGGAELTEAGAAGSPELCVPGAARFATSVVEHWFGDGQDFNQKTGFPVALLGPPDSRDTRAVVSLGNGGWVVLAFDGNAIVDGPGIDFTVFENPLPSFHELASVAISDDGESWVELPCTAAQDATDFGACAGVEPVLSSPSNGVDPLDPSVSGGDHYDLADFGVSEARYVRVTDRVDLVGMDGVFDLDAVAIVNARCP